ncbi:hypothetical protein ALO86_101626 [Pseudomonas syringae pv. berberidis]|nr:hypothetical protein ALO86_101626 [Pseudomonas syringae pv. berberidis]RMP61159.1 hypothetical protein ALQ19_101910 [Pseudomonas syringae pv. berberidis]RMQ44010.1 hypothetical protein ALQ06_101857 [Pseudomonas syringae pv. berberidis]RMR22341.1 hypothetical protein ALP89_101941 [Pseudomonas syringae pv. persicae]
MSTKLRGPGLLSAMPVAIHGRLTLNDRYLIAWETENT